MVGLGEQIRILLQKNVTLKKRNRVKTIMEILLPVYFIAGIVMNKFILGSIDFTMPGYNSYDPIPIVKFNTEKFVAEPVLVYSPNTSTGVNSIMSQIGLNSSQVQGFSSQKEMENFYSSEFFRIDNHTSHLVGAISVQNLAKNKVQYQLYVEGLQMISVIQGLTDNVGFLQWGYLSLQVSFWQALYRVIGKGNNTVLDFSVTQFPNLDTTFDFSQISSMSLATNLPFAYLFIMNQLAILVATEKEKKVHEALRIMGMSQIAYYLSWVLTQLIVALIPIILVVGVLFGVKVIEYGSIVAVFTVLTLYAVIANVIALVVTVFISRPRLASAVTSLILLLSNGLWAGIYLIYAKPLSGTKTFFLSLISGVPLSNFLKAVMVAEGTKTGVHLTSPIFWETIGLLVFDLLLYLLILWYFDNVYTGEYGVSKPWNFPFHKSYWIKQSAEDKASLLQNVDNENSAEGGVNIVDLCKNFKKVKAVDHLSLKVEQGEILALLGPNGAGKTTVIHVLTGLFPPTSGEISIMGFDYMTQIDEVRKIVGYCPQHNILLDQLTCAEHLRLFGRIKGTPQSQIEAEITKSLTEVELTDKTDTLSVMLSGGMKRKLSLAIAFIGGSSLVFLDECTSGMDPYSRRMVWKILQNYKKEKTIILTTHFMEEAELLGDHIAIMMKGKLRCQGTVLQLKNQFNVGYILRIVKTDEKANMEPLNEFIKGTFPENSRVPSPSILEAIYSIPNDNKKLGDFFERLQAQQSELHIKSFGLSVTTLEEVFLKITAETELGEDESTPQDEQPGGVELRSIGTINR